MPNKLAGEQSPYLLQHANNPVDWYPWGEEALERAQRENKPLLISIGYSACHWCHVMAHESFEDPAVAAIMNRHFVNVKVDREERPDVDTIYMEAVQALTGQGGWPLNVFALPDGRPFFGGTYFPPSARHGMPSWSDVLESIHRAYQEQGQDLQHNASVLMDYLQRMQDRTAGASLPGENVFAEAYTTARQRFDLMNGGFGSAPKFPQPLALEWLLRMHIRLREEPALAFVEDTLHAMASGGIHDQLGGGFHRYSVDAVWLVPHFEKMLYDNALLARLYLHAFQLTGKALYRSVVESTLDYMLRDLRSPDGAFYSAQDADSEGVEGKYYVWTPREIRDVLPTDLAEVALRAYAVTEGGNFEGKTILTRRVSLAAVSAELGESEERVERMLGEARLQLLEARRQRVPPGTDTKILVAWDALAIRALAEAGRVLDRPDYLAAARQAADFILTSLRPGGLLVRSYREAASSIPAFLDDYAFLAEAMMALYETTFVTEYLNEAGSLMREMMDRFWDPSRRAFFDAQESTVGETIVRPRSIFDNPIPSGNSAAAFALLRWQALTGDTAWSDQADAVLSSMADLLIPASLDLAYALSALDFALSPQRQIAIAGGPEDPATMSLVREIFQRYLPDAVVAVGEPDSSPLLAGRTTIDAKPAVYVCRNFACDLPVTEPEELIARLELN